VIRTRKAGTRALVIGSAVAAVACGSAAAAMPSFALHVHARLAPTAGTSAAGSFDGVLASDSIGKVPFAQAAFPRQTAWRLGWRLSLPPLRGPITASLRIAAVKGAAPVARVLCTPCALEAKGTMTLTASQGLRVAGSHAVVVVHAPAATLRGPVKVLFEATRVQR
jgi:hypothetical protein